MKEVTGVNELNLNASLMKNDKLRQKFEQKSYDVDYITIIRI